MKSIIRKKTKNLRKPISSKSRLMVSAEKLHIQAHLALTELRLRLFRSSYKHTRYQRANVLDTLNEYWKKGLFPKNTYEINQRKPVFIDSNGTYCAVGHLMVNTGYSDLAKSIDSSNKFVLVDGLDDNKSKEWLNQNGFTQKEASLIQPGYGGFVIERVSYSLQDKILGVVSLLASLVILAFVVVALRLLSSKTLPKPKKRNHFIKIATASAVIIVGFVLYLPTPKQAVESLTSGATSKETITCEGWNTPKNERQSVCNEFEEKGGVPGWREVPCEGICLL